MVEGTLMASQGPMTESVECGEKSRARMRRIGGSSRFGFVCMCVCVVACAVGVVDGGVGASAFPPPYYY